MEDCTSPPLREDEEEAPDVNFVEAGRAILERAGVQDGGAPRYSNVSAMYIHPWTGAVLHVGNSAVAASKASLQKAGISRVVFCQDEDGRCHFEGEAWIKYFRFPIGKWRTHLGSSPSPAQVLQFFEPMFQFVEAELAAGQGVLIHCLAGAHRAGTAGIAALMWLCHLRSGDATSLARRLRPAIRPIGGYPMILERLDASLASRRAAAAEPAAGGSGPTPCQTQVQCSGLSKLTPSGERH
mmetsp:Transcript_74386/g.172384  ORF Transcript_74386/g.172384 Transcript_74386/m.172384 type:complete len:240 (-) Transcript_74386:33-752(-)